MMSTYEKAVAAYYKKEKGTHLPFTHFDFFVQPRPEKADFEAIQESWTEKTTYNSFLLSKKAAIVTDASLKIVYASTNIIKINGYEITEVLGKSPKMFQGIGTDSKVTNRIRKAVLNGEPFKEVILNYKKDGQEYWCDIEGLPRFNKDGVLTHYIAFEEVA